MRRGTFTLILCLGLMLIGCTVILLGENLRPADLLLLPSHVLLGLGCLTLSAAAGLFGGFSLRRAAGRLSRQVEAMIRSNDLQQIVVPHPDLSGLVAATNHLVDSSHEAVQRALLQAKELEIQLKVVTAERQHAEAILYSISDAVLVTDPYDDVVLANEAAARTFDFDLATATRRPVDHILKDAKMIELIREMRQSESRNARRVVEHKLTSGRSERTYKVTLSCVADAARNRSGVVVVLHDMTKEKEVADMKNDFVSNVSHELRTPLASIKAYVEMLIDGEADDEKTKREFYEVIQGEANRLGRLIDNILNISRIESGLVKINKQPIGMTVIIKEALEVILPQAKQKSIRINDQLAPVFYQTNGDRDMLYQVVLNLLSNAVKYTPEGGVVTVSIEADESRKVVITRISDTGVGIPSKDLPFVFDKFYRSEVNNRMAKGTGLGLSLVKHIVEQVHRGRVWVESEIGKGSTFAFELELCA